MRPNPTPRQRARLYEAIDREINKLDHCRTLLHHVDATVLKARKDCFGTDPDFVQCLCEPAQALGGQIPLRTIRTAPGRQKVAGILSAIGHGIYL